jgi:hypothetical protein
MDLIGPTVAERLRKEAEYGKDWLGKPVWPEILIAPVSYGLEPS